MESIFREIFQIIDQGIIYQEASGHIKFWNRMAQDIFGLDPQQAAQVDVFEHEWHLIHADGSPCPTQEHPSWITLRTGKGLSREIRGLKRPDGSVVWLSINTKPVYVDGQSQPSAVVISFADISSQRRVDEERALTTEVLHLIQTARTRDELLRSVLMRLKTWSGCEAVGIRLRQGEDFPYFQTSGFPARFLRLENSLCQLGRQGEIVRDADLNPVLDCMCGNILQGRTDPGKPFFTPGGSFWSNSTTELLATTSEADRQARTRNRCNGEGYESVALIPLRAGGETFGLIQLNDKRKDRFSLEKINLLERLAGNVASYLANITAEDERQKLFNQWQLALRAARMGWWHYDPVGKISTWDQRYREIFGVEGFQGPNSEILKIIHPDDLPGVWKAVEAALDPKDPQSYWAQYRVRQPDGAWLWVEAHGLAAFEGQGEARRAVSFAGTVADITQRMQAQEALQRSMEQFRAIFENAPEGMALIDEQRCFLKVNPRLCQMLGYEPGELLGRSFNQFTHPDDRQAGRERWEELISGRASANRAEKRYLHKSGRVIWIYISNSSLRNRDGELQYVLSHIYDISERKKTEEALRLSEEKFAKAFKHSPLWVAITTMEEGRFIDVNETFLRVSGYAREEVIGLTAQDLGLRLDPAEREAMLALLGEQGSVRNLEVKRRVRSGQVLDMLLSAEILPMPGEVALVVVLADITELKKAQREREELGAQLRQAQKMEAVGTLAGGIAHDFNNILAAIRGYTELAQDPTSTKDETQEFLGQILTATTRAQKLVRQILTFSRKAEVHTRTVDLNRHVAETVELIRHTIPRMVDLELDLADNLKPIEGDPGQLEQIVLNLATNARDAMPSGGRLSISTKNVFWGPEYGQEFFQARPGEYVRLEVADTGQGMSQEVLAQIFDPFFTTKAAGKGTGLGLSTVYGIVKSHGGFINCASQPGQGSSFKVYFPALQAPDNAREVSGEAKAEEIAGGSETILMVDDEEPLRKLGSRLLSRKGYRVITANSGEEALEEYRKNPSGIDLVVLDLSMPGMGGWACLRELLDLDPEAKVLVASGYSSEGVLGDALQAGAAGYIAKPFQLAKMMESIRRVLDL